MARFKVINDLEKRLRRTNKQKARKASKRSIDWYKSQIKSKFSKKVIDPKRISATRNARGIKKTKSPNNRLGGENSISHNLNQNTTVDDRFKKDVKNTSRPLVGRMYFFVYDPKHKKTLPYYDVFPLVIVTDYYVDGFLGLNVHYLNYLTRAKLFDILLSIQKSQTVAGNEERYFDISYGILKAMSNNPYYKPTVKRYLYQHVRSPFAQVQSTEMENAVFLPVEQFRKANKRDVWEETKKLI